MTLDNKSTQSPETVGKASSSLFFRVAVLVLGALVLFLAVKGLRSMKDDGMQGKDPMPDSSMADEKVPEISTQEVPVEGPQASTKQPSLMKAADIATMARLSGPLNARTSVRQIKAVRAAQSSLPALTTTQVNSQIQDIIRINKGLKLQYRAQAVQLQRISEQARIHQKILANLESAKRVRSVSVPSGTSELIRQEKIRLIRDQTQENYEFIESLDPDQEEDETLVGADPRVRPALTTVNGDKEGE